MEYSVSTMDVDVPPAEGNIQRSVTKPYIEQLYSNEPRKCFSGVVELKFAVIGSSRAKAIVIEQGCVARLLQILRAPDSGLLLKTEVVTVLNSLAKGLPEHAASLVQAGVLPALWEQLEACGNFNHLNNIGQFVSKVSFAGPLIDTTNSDAPMNLSSTIQTTSTALCLNSDINSIADTENSNKNAGRCTPGGNVRRVLSNYTQMLLCCLRSVYRQGCVPPPPSWNQKLLSTLIKYGYNPPINQECVANILAYACKYEEQQMQLVSAGAGQLVASMLSSSLTKVQLPALHCLSALIKNNKEVAREVCGMTHPATGGISVTDRLVQLLGCYTEPPVQLAAATAIVGLHRAHALSYVDVRICNKTLQCLVRLCASDRPAWLRVEAARQIAHLTELSPELQKVSSDTDHLICTLKQFLTYIPFEGEPLPKPEQLSPNSCGQFDEVSVYADLMKEAGLLVFACLAANNEDIRQKVIAGGTVLDTITATLASGSPAVQLSAIRCLHSLSRSVHTLRTTFQDHMVWKPLLAMVQDSKTDEEMVIVALSTLCNLILAFSPSKDLILEQGCISHFCFLTRKDNYDLKLNAVWGLMNIAFQADASVKDAILHHLGTDQVFNLVSDRDTAVVMKALGLLRNLLCNKQHIDNIMRQHGNQIMQSVILILEGQHNTQVKEQALCILSNIADGEQAKEFILGNEDVLKKLFNYMVMPKLELQLASTCCIGNLAAADDPNPLDRQMRLREMKTEKVLESLLSTQDPNLYDKVRHALDQFKSTSTNNTSSSSSGGNSGTASNGSSSSSTPASHWRPLDQGQ